MPTSRNYLPLDFSKEARCRCPLVTFPRKGVWDTIKEFYTHWHSELYAGVKFLNVHG